MKIIIGMPAAEYHLVPGNGGSSLKTMIESPMAYWKRYLDPAREPEKSTPAMILGSAYHARIVEGQEGFEKAFYSMPTYVPEIEGLPVLDTVADIKAFFDKSGIEYKKSSPKPELIALIPKGTAHIWDHIEGASRSMGAGKVELKPDQWNEVEGNVKLLSTAASFAEIFDDGLSEVSIFWTDEETGLPCKARMDRVRPAKLHEVKTIQNSSGEEFEKLCIREIGKRKYNVAAVHYQIGWKHIIKNLEKLEIEIRDNTPRKKVDEILASFKGQWDFEFLFVQTGDVPFYMIRLFPERDYANKRCGFWHFGAVMRGHALSEIKRLSELFGDKPWMESQNKKAYDDADFPPWMVL